MTTKKSFPRLLSHKEQDIVSMVIIKKDLIKNGYKEKQVERTLSWLWPFDVDAKQIAIAMAWPCDVDVIRELRNKGSL